MGLSYTDAVKLMGGQSRTVRLLDGIAGGTLLAATSVGSGLILNLFEPKNELARLSDDLVREISQRLHGIDKLSSRQRLEAAHAVVVLAAFFEVLAEAELPLRAQDIKFTKAEQVALVTGGGPVPGRLGAIAASLLQAEVPMPTPDRSYEECREAIHEFYAYLSTNVLLFVTGLAVWESVGQAGQQRFSFALSTKLPSLAVMRYEDRFRRLVTDFPEVATWVSQMEHQATRLVVRRVGDVVDEVHDQLDGLLQGRSPAEQRARLSLSYEDAIGQPVLSSRDTPEGLTLPTLANSYIVPRFRIVRATVEAVPRLSDESWWGETAAGKEWRPARDDLEDFLLDYLESGQATRSLLLVLGQPGSGKSVLTQMLAAQSPVGHHLVLAADKFLVVRVALREVAADADPQTQIEDAIRAATGEAMSWPEFVRGADGAMPFILLDGFDELLQATGVSQTDYLDKLGKFQLREAKMGRPVAVLITSRTAVADRAGLPIGSVVIRLEPFSDEQIATWVQGWNDVNVGPLPLDTILQHRELSSQPLLLIMLAIHYAGGYRLSRQSDEADLYEQILVGFIRREIGKSRPDLPDEQLERAIEDEFLRLSVMACGMFSRSRQWISDTELDKDLPALLGASALQAAPMGLRAPLTDAQRAVGRFFFIHEARATRDNTTLHTYGFLHATFGEYLVARIVTRELAELAEGARMTASRARQQPPSDAFLYALLSYMPLTMSGTVVSFLEARLSALPDVDRRAIHTLALSLLPSSLDSRRGSRYDDYEPVQTRVTARCAAYSANLAMVAVLSANEVSGSDLFPGSPEPVAEWRDMTMLWRSQLPTEGWEGLLDAVALVRIGGEERPRDIILRYDKEAGQVVGNLDMYWSYNRPRLDEWRKRGRPFGWSMVMDKDLRGQAWFQCDVGDDTIMYALEPFKEDLDGAFSSFHSYWEDGRPVSTARAWLELLLTFTSECTPEELAAAFDTCLEIAIRARFGSETHLIREPFRHRFFTLLAASRQRVPPDWLSSVITRIRAIVTSEPGAVFAPEELVKIAASSLPELLEVPAPDVPAEAGPLASGEPVS